MSNQPRSNPPAPDPDSPIHEIPSNPHLREIPAKPKRDLPHADPERAGKRQTKPTAPAGTDSSQPKQPTPGRGGEGENRMRVDEDKAKIAQSDLPKQRRDSIEGDKQRAENEGMVPHQQP